jgi:NAD(P)-dependent dehydrogenase (short-subunit alcohol dehydrogenase family)
LAAFRQADRTLVSRHEPRSDRPDQSAAMDCAPRGIRINAVCPGVIDTPMSGAMGEDQAEAMKEIMRDQTDRSKGRADEIAAAALRLCSPASSFVLGVALPVDGGFSAH